MSEVETAGQGHAPLGLASYNRYHLSRIKTGGETTATYLEAVRDLFRAVARERGLALTVPTDHAIESLDPFRATVAGVRIEEADFAGPYDVRGVLVRRFLESQGLGVQPDGRM